MEKNHSFLVIEPSKGNAEQDFQSLVSFYDTLTVEKKTLQITIEKIRRADFIVLLKKNHSLIGFAGVLRLYSLIPVLFMVVSAEHQGLGYGQELLGKVHETGKGNYCFLTLKVSKDHAPTIHIYEKAGYTKFGQTGQDAFYMYPYRKIYKPFTLPLLKFLLFIFICLFGVGPSYRYYNK